MRQVAERLGFRFPLLVRIVAEPEVAVLPFHMLGDTWTEVLGEDGNCPEDLYEALGAALATRTSRPAWPPLLLPEEDPMGIAIEPPLAVRPAALPEHLGFGWDVGAPVPLRDADTLERWCVRDLVSPEKGLDELRPVRLLDLAPERFEMGRTRSRPARERTSLP